jgi:putative oxidoreductase
MRKRGVAIAGEALLWVISLFLVYVFITQGVAKFDHGSGWSKAFRLWHYPDWFRVLIGVIEVTAAALLLTRRFATIGAAMIVVVMLGGMATHVWTGRPKQVTSEVVPLVLATIVAVARRNLLFPRKLAA